MPYKVMEIIMARSKINTAATNDVSEAAGWIAPLRRMHAFPAMSAADARKEARRIGETGELAFRAFLVSRGFSVVDFSDIEPADAGIMLGKRCVRFQVKTVAACRDGYYHSTFQRGFGGSAKGVFEYSAGDYDVGVTAIPAASTFVFHTDQAKKSFRVHERDLPALRRSQRDRIFLALIEIGALDRDDIEQISTPYP
ncbi:hypothetical protein [Tateyamaria pelophila]|uniref:hypothetical protein n=1 Tax=Tateyamaria pelophila TaxID=328415 RepID=UPI001CBAF8E6|nr:hypothetical protein [Tateyamaria pelophila]